MKENKLMKTKTFITLFILFIILLSENIVFSQKSEIFKSITNIDLKVNSQERGGADIDIFDSDNEKKVIENNGIKAPIKGTASWNYDVATGSVGTTYSWIDCSSGTSVGTGDDSQFSLAWPFNFSFYDDNYTTADNLSICTNGFIRLDGAANTSSTTATNYDLSVGDFNLGEIVALGVYDAKVGDGGGYIRYLVQGTSPNRIFTIEYNNLEIDWNDGRYSDFEVSFYESLNKIVILFNTENINKNGADVGICSGVDTYFHYWGHANGLTDNTWVEYTPPTPCATPADQPTSLNLTPTNTTVDGTFTAATSSPDGYLIIISTNSTLSANPVDGTTYSAGDAIGGGTVVQSGAGTSFSATGLAEETQYYFFIFSQNFSCSGGPLYYLTSPLTGSITTLAQPYSKLPYSTSFEDGSFDSYWKSSSENSFGRIQITTANTPHTGSYHLTMDVNTDNNYATNESRLHLDLASETEVDLSFWFKEFGDEDDAEDGIFFSDDGGNTFTEVFHLDGGAYTNNTYYEINLDVDALAASNGLSLTDKFIIKFQQRDNYSISSDGFAFDDINVTRPGCTLWSENFDALSTQSDLDGTGNWEYTEITPSANDWGIAGSGSDYYLSIYNGSIPEQYNTSDDGEEIAFYNIAIDAREYKNLTIDFDWKSNGQSASDYGTIVWSIDGVNWAIVNNTQYQGQSSFVSASGIDLSVCDGQQFYLGFRWISDSSSGSNPPFAVDNIVIKGYPKFDYNFSYRQDNFEQITGTVVTLDAQDGANISLPSGFDFSYDGTAVTTIRANENGWLEMGNALTTSPLVTNQLADVANIPILAPFWDDLTSDSQTRIIYLVEGAAPTRVFTVEWKDVLWGGVRQNFQVKLYETSNVIEFWYGTMNTNNIGSTSIGINNYGGCMNKLISVTPGTVPTASYSVENSTINSTTNLNSGLVYIFNPLFMQSYLSWEAAKIVVGQTDFTTINTTASQTVHEGANSSVVSSKGVLASSGGSANRVLLWKSIQTSNGAPADIVLGQTNFTSTTSGTSATQLNSPKNVCFTPDGNKLLVADGSNNRVLIWNSIPTSNGQAADIVLGQPDFTSSSSGCSDIKFDYPTGIIVLPDGKLLVTDNGNNRVIVYNSVPTVTNTPADYVIGQPDFTTNSVGTTADKLGSPWDCAYSPDGKLLISDDNSHRIMIYNSVPTTFGASADNVIGNTVFGAKAAGSDKDEFDQPSVTCSVEGRLAIADYGNSRVMIYERIPEENGAAADYVLGQPNFVSTVEYNDGFGNTGSPSDKNMYLPYSICFDLNGRLYVNGTRSTGVGMHRIMVFGETPTDVAELELSIVADETDVCIYSDVEYTVQVTNNGPNDASSVVVNAQLPVDFTATNYDASVGTYNQKSGYWYIPYVAVGQTVTLMFAGEVQPGLAGSSVTAYANIIASKQADSDFSNNGASEVVAVRTFYAPTSTDIPDQYINRDSHTIPVISFTVDDQDGSGDYPLTYACTSSNTVLIPLNYTTNLIFAGSEPDKTLDIYPAVGEYGYSDMELILSDIHGCHKDYPFKVIVGNIWEGDDVTTSHTDWTVAENWSSGNVPTSTIEAIIPTSPIGGYFPIIDVAGAICEDLLIEPKASVIVNDGFTLHVYGDATIESDISGTGSLVDINTSTGQVTVDGTSTVQRYIVNDAWHYVSSPLSNVSNAVLTENVCGTDYNSNTLDYNENYIVDNDLDGDIDWMDGWERNWVAPNADLLQISNGYAYYTFASSCSNLVEFTGVSSNFNTGNYSYAVTNQDDTYMGVDDGFTSATNPHHGWNLIGNPYPSGLDAEDFMAANNSVIDGTVYFWDEMGATGFDPEGSDYAAYNTAFGTGTTGTGTGSGSVVPDQYISCGQAFFVHKTSSTTVSENITFSNSMRETENSYFFKKKEKTNPEIPKIKLSVTNPLNMYNEIVVGMAYDASETIDGWYDGYKPEGNAVLSLYSLKEGKGLMFNAVPMIEGNERKSIPIGLNAGIEGKYRFNTIMIEYIPDTIGVYLEDKELNEIVDLRKVKEYEFKISEIGRYNDRFILHFNLNHAPELVYEIPDKTIKSEEYSEFIIPSYSFEDSDFDKITFSAILVSGEKLPTWLKFDNDNNTFSGIPTNNDAKVYPIRITATDVYGATAYDEFNLQVLSASDVYDIEEGSIKVYPNPSNGIVYISNTNNSYYTYKVMDVSGKILKETGSTSNRELVDISMYPSGIYFVNVIVDGRTSNFKIFLQK